MRRMPERANALLYYKQLRDVFDRMRYDLEHPKSVGEEADSKSMGQDLSGGALPLPITEEERARLPTGPTWDEINYVMDEPEWDPCEFWEPPDPWQVSDISKCEEAWHRRREYAQNFWLAANKLPEEWSTFMGRKRPTWDREFLIDSRLTDAEKAAWAAKMSRHYWKQRFFHLDRLKGDYSLPPQPAQFPLEKKRSDPFVFSPRWNRDRTRILAELKQNIAQQAEEIKHNPRRGGGGHHLPSAPLAPLVPSFPSTPSPLPWRTVRVSVKGVLNDCLLHDSSSNPPSKPEIEKRLRYDLKKKKKKDAR